MKTTIITLAAAHGTPVGSSNSDQVFGTDSSAATGGILGHKPAAHDDISDQLGFAPD
ncbi:MAG: hypothetical protein Q7T74_04710 [Candidatus Saccharibacteria bacterium]|nr:hypothetical protein [Candidatus Saccharibacteria bacterium]